MGRKKNVVGVPISPLQSIAQICQSGLDVAGRCDPCSSVHYVGEEWTLM